MSDIVLFCSISSGLPDTMVWCNTLEVYVEFEMKSLPTSESKSRRFDLELGIYCSLPGASA